MISVKWERFVPLAFCAVVLLTAGCDNFAALCANEITQTIASPDGKVKAVIFTRDCGATTGFSTQVFVLPAGNSLPNESGNAFAEREGSKVDVAWTTNRELRIRHTTATDWTTKRITVATGLFLKETVTVTYTP